MGTMSGMHGADTGQLREFATRLRSASERLTGMSGQVAGLLNSVNWDGPDADHFRHVWTSDLKQKLTEVARVLGESGTTLERNATEQDKASGLLPGGGLGGGHSGGGGGTTGGGGNQGGGQPDSGPPTGWSAGASAAASWGKKDTLSISGDEGTHRWGTNDPKKDEGKVRVQVAGAHAQVGATYHDENVDVLLGAKAEGKVYVGSNGLSVDGSVIAGVQASAHGSAAIAPYTDVTGKVTVTAGALASGSASISTEGANLSGKAFAGAKIEGQAGVDVGGVYGGVKGEAWAGIGIEGSAKYGFQSDGKWHISLSGGAALGVGGKIGIDLAFDPGKIVNTVTDIGSKIGKFFGFGG